MDTKTIKHRRQTNGWDFLIELTRGIFNLINSGGVFSIPLLVSALSIFFVSIRISSEESVVLFKALLGLIDSSLNSYLMVTLLISILIAVIVWSNRKIQGLKCEIERLAEERKRLIHGFKESQFKHIEEHSTSGFSINKD